MSSRIVEHRSCNSIFSLGQRPGISKIQTSAALKARFNSNANPSRAFSARIFSNQKNPGTMPQASNEVAPLALHAHGNDKANIVGIP